METIIVLGVLALVFAFLLAKTAQSLVHISGPNEVLVFSGLTNRSGTSTRGYKVIKGGKGFRVPLFEVVDRMDLTNMVIDVSVSGAYSKGGIPLNVQAVANVKIAGDEPVIHNALERLLGKDRESVIRLARETLEGNLRGVLATLTPEQVNEDKNAFAQSLLAEAEHDLSALGLNLDTLKIQNVTDDQGYLQAIGRKQSAELLKRARSAEALARAEAAVTEAKNREETLMAQIEARMEVAKAEANRRVVDAKTQRVARTAEEEAEVTSLVARATADMEVQKARIEQIERKLRAEVIAPAVARRDALIQEAEGAAAEVIEDGRARAEALGDITRVWMSYGESAKRALMMQKLEPIAELLTSTIDQVHVDNITFIGDGGGRREDEPFSVKALRTMEEFRHASGVDVAGIAKRFSGEADSSTSSRPPRERSVPMKRREETADTASSEASEASEAAEVRETEREEKRERESSQAGLQQRVAEAARDAARDVSERVKLPETMRPGGVQSRRNRGSRRDRTSAGSRDAQTRERANRGRSQRPADGGLNVEWYAASPDGRYGPMTFSSLRDQVETGEIPSEAYIWRNGLSDWEPLQESEAWLEALALDAGRDGER